MWKLLRLSALYVHILRSLNICYDTDKENLTVQNSWSFKVCGHAGSIFHHLPREAYLYELGKLELAIVCKLLL